MILLCGCITANKQQAKKISQGHMDVLIGPLTRAELFTEFPAWQDEYDLYQPDQKIIQKLSQIKNKIDIDIFFGTWCKDSRREVPRFFKILDLSRFTTEESINMWAVDRDKRLSNGLAKKNDVHFVATFIFKTNQKELGRIIEEPFNRLESDILTIIQGKQ